MDDYLHDVIYSDPLCTSERQGRQCPAVTIRPSAWEPIGAARHPGGRWGLIRALVTINGAEVYLVAELDSPSLEPTASEGHEGGRFTVRRRWYRPCGFETA